MAGAGRNRSFDLKAVQQNWLRQIGSDRFAESASPLQRGQKGPRFCVPVPPELPQPSPSEKQKARSPWQIENRAKKISCDMNGFPSGCSIDYRLSHETIYHWGHYPRFKSMWKWAVGSAKEAPRDSSSL
jgi:hypothetical protein